MGVPSNQYLPGKSLYAFLVCKLCSCHSRDGPPNHQALIANRTCIYESHRIIENKQFLNRYRSPLPQPNTWDRHRMIRKKYSSSSFFMEGA